MGSHAVLAAEQQREKVKRTVKVGILGLGTVGCGVVKLLQEHREDLYQQTEMDIVVEKILVKDLEKVRGVQVDRSILTTDSQDVLHHPEIDVVIEVMGGIEPTKQYLLQALANGKQVVSANKDLIALHGAEILKKAAENGCDVYYEASVGGGIPILRSIVDGFASDRIRKIIGIVNGTTNYILTKMSQENEAYEHVLREAQQLGYAESDPTADVEGLDAARKMAILSTLGFHMNVTPEDVDCQGISQVTIQDIAYAQQLGYEIKLLGVAELEDGLLEVNVQPTLIHRSHPLAAVHGVYNALYVYGDAVGETMFYGPGAGELPTATAVVSDLVSVIKKLKMNVNGQGVTAPYRQKRLKNAEQSTSKYFVRLQLEDRAGVFNQVTRILAEQQISMEEVFQQPLQGQSRAEIVMITHETSKARMEQAIKEFKALDVLHQIRSIYRVEGEKQ